MRDQTARHDLGMIGSMERAGLGVEVSLPVKILAQKIIRCSQMELGFLILFSGWTMCLKK